MDSKYFIGSHPSRHGPADHPNRRQYSEPSTPRSSQSLQDHVVCGFLTLEVALLALCLTAILLIPTFIWPVLPWCLIVSAIVVGLTGVLGLIGTSVKKPIVILIFMVLSGICILWLLITVILLGVDFDEKKSDVDYQCGSGCKARIFVPMVLIFVEIGIFVSAIIIAYRYRRYLLANPLSGMDSKSTSPDAGPKSILTNRVDFVAPVNDMPARAAFDPRQPSTQFRRAHHYSAQSVPQIHRNPISEIHVQTDDPRIRRVPSQKTRFDSSTLRPIPIHDNGSYDEVEGAWLPNNSKLIEFLLRDRPQFETDLGVRQSRNRQSYYEPPQTHGNTANNKENGGRMSKSEIGLPNGTGKRYPSVTPSPGRRY